MLKLQLSELSFWIRRPRSPACYLQGRSFHKSGCRCLQICTALAEFSHQFEALLDRMRDGRIRVTQEGVGVLFRASDILSAMVDAAENETTLLDDFGSQILEEIKALISVG